MTTQLSRRQADERRATLAQMVELDATRLLLRAGATHLESFAALTDAIEGLQRVAERHAAAAVGEGESYADVARAGKLSRQGARKRYGHLHEVV